MTVWTGTAPVDSGWLPHGSGSGYPSRICVPPAQLCAPPSQICSPDDAVWSGSSNPPTTWS